jgi:hypothetical protein
MTMNAWGQFAGKCTGIHRQGTAAKVVASDSRFTTHGHTQGLSSGKPLITQAKIAFSTERAALYYYHQS